MYFLNIVRNNHIICITHSLVLIYSCLSLFYHGIDFKSDEKEKKNRV